MQPFKVTSFRISSTSTILGAIVTGAVYSSILISGEIVSYITASSIQIMSSILGYATELIIGGGTGEVVKNIGKHYGDLVKPAINTIYRLSAITVSVGMGASTAVTTSLFTYTGKKIIRYATSLIKDYSKCVSKKSTNLIPIAEKEHINPINTPEFMRNKTSIVSKNTLLEQFKLLIKDKEVLMLKDSVIK